jgi:hypothetical protein
VRYLLRRFVPQASDSRPLAVHTLVQGDRLDTITFRYLGEPTQFWRVCDANAVLSPFDLTAESDIGMPLVIPVPQA